MFVAVHRLYKRSYVGRERCEKPLQLIEADNLDHAIEIFERDYRWKYPENWGYEFEEDTILKEILAMA